MIKLTRQQRDFLDRYYTEYMKLEAGPATALGTEHGFYYEHLKALFEAYRQSWGGDLAVWGDIYPPVCSSPDPLFFPWPSIQALEEQLKAEGITVSPLPRLTSIVDKATIIR